MAWLNVAVPPVPVVHECVIDGVPAFWVETPPPLTVSLSFRVGTWDETVLTRGITHLVEHLAFHPLRDAEHPFNGWVTGDSMTFWATGTEAQVCGFFATLCRSLRAIPVDRLEKEVGVLHAEASARGTTFADQLLATFFGPNGPGLFFHPERGLDLAGPKEIQAWGDRHCVRGNAVLTLSGPPPAGLRIDLPEGARRPLRLPGEDVGYRPKRLERVHEQEAGICLAALTKRTAAVVLGWEALSARLTDRLRHDLGLVYQVATSYLPLDGTTAFLYAGVDAPREKVDGTVNAFMDVVHALRDKGPSEDEVARLQRIGADAVNVDPVTFARNELWRVATARLLGHPAFTWEELMAERAAAKAADVRDAFRAATGSAAVIAPARPDLKIPGTEDAPVEPLDGKRFRPRHKADGAIERLVVGPQGLSAYHGRRWFTVRWSDLALAEKAGPSQWTLLHRNGSWLRLDTAAYWWRGRLARLIDTSIPNDVRVPQPRRA